MELKTKQWADIYGVNIRTIQNWLQGECPDLENLSKVYKWVSNRPRNRATLRPFEEAKGMLEEILKKDIDDAPGLIDGENSAEKYSKAWWDIEKIRLSVKEQELKLAKLSGELISKQDHTTMLTDMIDLIFRGFEESDEEMAEAWEGREAVKIMQGRKNERDSLRNAIANTIEKSLV